MRHSVGVGIIEALYIFCRDAAIDAGEEALLDHERHAITGIDLERQKSIALIDDNRAHL